MSTARMFLSDVCAWVSACFAASSVEVFELPTSSMIFTTAKTPPLSPERTLSRRAPAAAADLPRLDPLLERDPLPPARLLARGRGGRGGGGEMLHPGAGRRGLWNARGGGPPFPSAAPGA